MIDVKNETAKRLKDKVPEETVFELFSVGLITEGSAKRFLIADDFEKSNPKRGEKSTVKNKLADRYCVSADTVDKYLSRSEKRSQL